MADLEITVGVVGNQDLAKLSRNLETVKRDANRLGEQFRKGQMTSQAYFKAQNQLIGQLKSLGVNYKQAQSAVFSYGKAVRATKEAEDKAADMKKYFAAQRQKLALMEQSRKMEERAAAEAERSAMRQAQAAERVREQYLPLYAASKQYERSLEEISRAHSEGVLTTAQYETALENLNMQYNQLNNRGTGSTRVLNDFGMATQQVGYQVGDFLVQVQSGTNAFVAFGQQATQLVGILPLFADKMGVSAMRLVGISATLGIVIPLVTALAAGLMRVRSEAEDSSSAMSDLESSISSLSRVTVDLVRDNERVKESFRAILDVVEEVEMKAVQQSLEAILQPFEDAIRKFERDLDNFRRMGSGFLGMGRGPEIDLFGLNDLEKVVQVYEILNGIQGDTRKELSESVRQAELWLRGSGLLTEEVKQLLAEYAKAVGVVEEAKEETEQTRGEAKILSDILSSLEMDNILSQFDSLNEKMGSAIFGSGTLLGRLGAAFSSFETLARRAEQGRIVGRGRGAVDPRDVGGSFADWNNPENRLIINYGREMFTPPNGSRSGGGGAGSAIVDELTQAQQQVEEISKTMQSSMSDAFMSMVDGTKSVNDAFKDMARAIIKQLFDVLVVQQLVGSFGFTTNDQGQRVAQGSGLAGFLGKALNGALTGTAATGGTLMPGGAYLVGEKGPEIVMPGTRSTVMNDNLSAKAMSGGGQVVDVRVFVDDNGNFDAKVDRISQRNISRAAPAIVNQSVGQVINQVKRGGSTKDAFK